MKYNLSESEKQRIRNLHIKESQKPAISSVLKEQEEIDLSFDTPSIDTQLPVAMGDIQLEPQAKEEMPIFCRDVLIEWCQNIGNPPGPTTWPICITIDGEVPTQGDLGKYIRQPHSNCPGACNQTQPNWQSTCYACRTGKVIEVCGPGTSNPPYVVAGFIPCSVSHSHVINQGIAFADWTTVTDCNWLGGGSSESWNCEGGTCVLVQGTGGQYQTEQDCLNNCEGNRYSCVPTDRAPNNEITEQVTGNMRCVQDPMGQYSSMSDCEQNCQDATIDCINCEEGIMAQVTSPDPCPPGFSPIGSDDLHTGPCVECDNSVCTPCGWCYGYNHFNSMADCQASPNCSAGGYTCNGTGPNATCQPDPNSTQTLSQCQANCPPPPGTWKCNLNVGCSQHPSGSYPDQVTCETDCCSQTIVSWTWPPYVNGNPTCNEICAKLNTGAMQAAAAGNPINFRHKCRYDWLITQFNALGCPQCSASNGCCDRAGYLSATMAAQYQVSSSPYCLNANSQFIPMVTNAMNGNNNSNTPFGCIWLNIVQGDLLSQLPAPNAGTQCNKEGRISWLEELMTTGTAPGFIPDMTTMTTLYPNGVFVPC